MNGTWMNDASGSQCAFDGIGRTGFAGILPPTSAKIQTKSTLKAVPGRELPCDVHVVEGIGIRRIGEAAP